MPRKAAAADRAADARTINAARLIEHLESGAHAMTLPEWAALLRVLNPAEYANPPNGPPEPIVVETHEAMIRVYMRRETDGYELFALSPVLFRSADVCLKRPRQIAESAETAESETDHAAD